MGLRPITWGMAWGDVPRPAGTDENAPFDVALLAPFDRRPVLTAEELLGFVGPTFAKAGAPLDLARVDEWLTNAEARNLIEAYDGPVGERIWVITQRGERRLRSVRFAGLAVITMHPVLGLIARFAFPVAVIVTGFTLGATAVLLLLVIVALGVLAVVTMSRRDRKPLVLRKTELVRQPAAGDRVAGPDQQQALVRQPAAGDRVAGPDQQQALVRQPAPAGPAGELVATGELELAEDG